jgi:hypothetical protein
MQRTRLNTLVDFTLLRFEQFFSNPWRRTSLILIGFLAGIFVAQAVSTTGGQAAEWDVIMAAFILLFTEIVSILAYRRSRRRTSEENQERSLLLNVLNVFKMGVTYSLFLEAFKLGS